MEHKGIKLPFPIYKLKATTFMFWHGSLGTAFKTSRAALTTCSGAGENRGNCVQTFNCYLSLKLVKLCCAWWQKFTSAYEVPLLKGEPYLSYLQLLLWMVEPVGGVGNDQMVSVANQAGWGERLVFISQLLPKCFPFASCSVFLLQYGLLLVSCLGAELDFFWGVLVWPWGSLCLPTSYCWEHSAEVAILIGLIDFWFRVLFFTFGGVLSVLLGHPVPNWFWGAMGYL